MHHMTTNDIILALWPIVSLLIVHKQSNMLVMDWAYQNDRFADVDTIKNFH